MQVGAERYREELIVCGERMGDTTPNRGAAGGDEHAVALERGGAVASVGCREGVNVIADRWMTGPFLLAKTQGEPHT